MSCANTSRRTPVAGAIGKRSANCQLMLLRRLLKKRRNSAQCATLLRMVDAGQLACENVSHNRIGIVATVGPEQSDAIIADIDDPVTYVIVSALLMNVIFIAELTGNEHTVFFCGFEQPTASNSGELMK